MERINFKVLERFGKGIEKGFRPILEFKLNRTEIELLMLLEHKPDMPFKDYGRMIRLEKSSFTYLVDLLETKGLVNKIDDEDDRRRKYLEITQKGKDTVIKLKELHHEFMQERLKIFTETEIKELRKAVETIERLTEKLPERPRPDRDR